MDTDELLLHFRELAQFAGWTGADSRRVAGLRERIEPRLAGAIDDFQEAVDRCAGSRSAPAVGAGGLEQLRAVLWAWLAEFCSDAGDRDRATRCQRVGVQTAELGLPPATAHLAFSRLRSAIRRAATGDEGDPASAAALESLEKRLDLDLAVIWHAHGQTIARRLRQAERAETIRQITGGVAHELRQPLNILRTSAYYLRNAKNPAPAKSAEHLQRMEQQVAWADRIIHAMSAFAKLPAPAVAPVSIPQALEAALDANPVRPDIAVSIDCPEGIELVPGDPDQLQVALGNLIRNAGDAMPEGGRLSLTVRDEDRCVAIGVSDTGIGIAASEVERITEPLYTTKVRGMGLGLAITRSIVENHGGEVRVESEPGMGSTFTVTLPRAPVTTADEESPD
jgi:signal transduction histidine kinase